MSKTNVISIACDAGEFYLSYQGDLLKRCKECFPVGSRVVNPDHFDDTTESGVITEVHSWGVVVLWDATGLYETRPHLRVEGVPNSLLFVCSRSHDDETFDPYVTRVLALMDEAVTERVAL